MSENTNTLFWVITGAVIILAVFLLIQSNVGGAITGIFDHFNSLFTSGS